MIVEPFTYAETRNLVDEDLTPIEPEKAHEMVERSDRNARAWPEDFAYYCATVAKS